MKTSSPLNQFSAFLFVVADIGANLTDGMYRGEYHGGSKKHEPDLGDVLERSWKEGLTHIIVTGGSVSDAKEAIQLAKTGLVIKSTLFCSLFTIKDRCKKGRFLQTHYQSLRQLFLKVSLNLRGGVLVNL